MGKRFYLLVAGMLVVDCTASVGWLAMVQSDMAGPGLLGGFAVGLFGSLFGGVMAGSLFSALPGDMQATAVGLCLLVRFVVVLMLVVAAIVLTRRNAREASR